MYQINKIQKFSFLYLVAVGTYYLFDFVYMPWLSYEFGNMIFVPLYPSILIANFAGVYAYNYFNEDVLFIELGKNWINNDKGRYPQFRQIINKRKFITFTVLSVWPSPIASYLFFRQKSDETPYKIFKVIAVGSIFCTIFWGGGLSVLRFLLLNILRQFKLF